MKCSLLAALAESMRPGKTIMHLLATATAIALVTAMAGCMPQPTRAVPAVPMDLTDQAQIPGMQNVRGWGDGHSPVIEASIRESLSRQKAAGQGLKEINVLAISGGGAEGAYGAGILCGWTETGTRPAFSAVTGISTGALAAPFAFLGPAYDKPLREFYTTVTTKDILRRRSLLKTFSSDAAADSDPLKQLLVQAMTADMLRAIAAEHAKGRRLFIGTTNLDAQRPVVWDMGAIAASGRPEALDLFRKIMLASASIPAAFPPQYFDVVVDGKTYQEMHVDGGTMTQVFHFGQMLDYRKVRAELKEFSPDLPRRVYVIRNGLVRPDGQSVTPRFIPIANRAVGTLLKANAAGDLYRIYAMCRMEGMQFQVAYIPDQHASQAKEAFDKVEMQRLFNLGRQDAKSGAAWKKLPPGVVAGSDEAIPGTRLEQTPSR